VCCTHYLHNTSAVKKGYVTVKCGFSWLLSPLLLERVWVRRKYTACNSKFLFYILIYKRILKKKRNVLFLLTPPSPAGEGF